MQNTNTNTPNFSHLINKIEEFYGQQIFDAMQTHIANIEDEYDLQTAIDGLTSSAAGSHFESIIKMAIEDYTS